VIARRRLVLAVILAVAFLIRLAAVLLIDVDPRVGWHYDMTWYDGVARRLLKGWGYINVTGAPTAAWPPGYPLLLVAVYSVFGPSLLAAKIANALLGTATVLLTHLIACQLGRPGVALVAAAIVALFPGLVLFSPLLLSETLFVLSFCAVLWLFLRWRERGVGSWIGLGIWLGAISLVRGVGFFLLPAFASTRLLEGASWRATTRCTLAAAAGILIALAPWTLRNQLRLGYPVLIASDGAFSLYVGNSPIATGEHTFSMREPLRERFGELMALPGPQAEVEVARAQIREALSWMAAHPHRVIAMAPAKIYHMYRNDLGAVPWMKQGLAKRLSPGARRQLHRIVDGYYFAVLALALVGARHFLPRAGHGAVVLPLTVVWITIIHAIFFFGSSRLHVPLLPVLALMAAAEMVAWAERFSWSATAQRA
jgi:4-amino-4-deoxy-L-arabinose transferase-like glycosyltransferase